MKPNTKLMFKDVRCKIVICKLLVQSKPRLSKVRYLFSPKISKIPYSSVSQPPGHGPVPGPGINYTGPREVILEFVILVF